MSRWYCRWHQTAVTLWRVAMLCAVAVLTWWENPEVGFANLSVAKREQPAVPEVMHWEAYCTWSDVLRGLLYLKWCAERPTVPEVMHWCLAWKSLLNTKTLWHEREGMERKAQLASAPPNKLVHLQTVGIHSVHGICMVYTKTWSTSWFPIGPFRGVVSPSTPPVNVCLIVAGMLPPAQYSPPQSIQPYGKPCAWAWALTAIPMILFAEIELHFENGLPSLLVPLPSRREVCQFTLRPVSNTLGDFISYLQTEDHGIDRVVAFSSGGWTLNVWGQLTLWTSAHIYTFEVWESNTEIVNLLMPP